MLQQWLCFPGVPFKTLTEIHQLTSITFILTMRLNHQDTQQTTPIQSLSDTSSDVLHILWQSVKWLCICSNETQERRSFRGYNQKHVFLHPILTLDSFDWQISDHEWLKDDLKHVMSDNVKIVAVCLRRSCDTSRNDSMLTAVILSFIPLSRSDSDWCIVLNVVCIGALNLQYYPPVGLTMQSVTHTFIPLTVWKCYFLYITEWTKAFKSNACLAGKS